MKHLIHKINLESHFSGAREAKEFQEYAASVLEEALQNEVSEWMDQHAMAEEIISIEKIEIELSAFYPGNWDSWKEVLIQQLKEKLELALLRHEWNEDNNVTIRLQASDELINWMFFWHYGHWPWSMSADSLPEALSDDQIDKLSGLISEKRKELITLLNEEATFIRCYLSMEQNSFGKFMSKVEENTFFKQAFTLVMAFLTFRHNKLLSSRTIGQSLSIFWKHWHSEIRGINDPVIQSEKVLNFLLRIERGDLPSGTKTKDGQSPASIHDETDKPVLSTFLKDNQAQLSTDHLKLFERALTNLINEDQSLNVNPSESLEIEQKSVSEKSDRREESRETDKRLALDSGVVILHPFLQVLFKEAGACDEKMERLTQPDIALQLLQYLVYGDSKVPIGGDATSKILIGQDKTYVQEPFELNKALKSECDTLLKSVIHHWKILKKTSPEGLRVSFLQRQGSIEPKDEFDLLQVEKQSYDILLEHLPWSYSIVKLPWMVRPLHVKWNNM